MALQKHLPLILVRADKRLVRLSVDQEGIDWLPGDGFEVHLHDLAIDADVALVNDLDRVFLVADGSNVIHLRPTCASVPSDPSTSSCWYRVRWASRTLRTADSPGGQSASRRPPRSRGDLSPHPPRPRAWRNAPRRIVCRIARP